MATYHANNDQQVDPRWSHYRARRSQTDSTFQFTSTVVGPSFSPDRDSDKELPLSPLAANGANTLTPPVGHFDVFRGSIPATQSVHDRWFPITGLPNTADLSVYSLQSYKDTQVAQGSISLQSYWDRRQENAYSKHDSHSLAAQYQWPCFRYAAQTDQPQPFPAAPLTPSPSCVEVAEGPARAISDATNRRRSAPRPARIDVDVANNRPVIAQTSTSAVDAEPPTAVFSPRTDGVAFNDPFTQSFRARPASPEEWTSPRAPDQNRRRKFTQPLTPQPDAVHTPRISKERRPSRDFVDRILNQEELDFILYLSLQGIRNEVVGLELARLTTQMPHSGNRDVRLKLLAKMVLGGLKTIAKQKGGKQDADEKVDEVMIRADKEGWSQGLLSRARAQNRTVVRGKSVDMNANERKQDARCRAAFKKWWVNHNGTALPRENAPRRDEQLAFQGMLLDGTASEVDGPDPEVMKRNLLELWESGTIEGKALK